MYANVGRVFDVKIMEFVDTEGTVDEDGYVDLAVEWYHKGARVIGGCC